MLTNQKLDEILSIKNEPEKLKSRLEELQSELKLVLAFLNNTNNENLQAEYEKVEQKQLERKSQTKTKVKVILEIIKDHDGIVFRDLINLLYPDNEKLDKMNKEKQESRVSTLLNYMKNRKLIEKKGRKFYIIQKLME